MSPDRDRHRSRRHRSSDRSRTPSSTGHRGSGHGQGGADRPADRGRADRPHGGRVPAAQRDPAGVTARGHRPRRDHRGRPRFHGHDRRGSRHSARPARRSGLHRRQPARPRACAGSPHPSPTPRAAPGCCSSPRARGASEVVGHHEPGGLPRRSQQERRGDRRRRLGFSIPRMLGGRRPPASSSTAGSSRPESYGVRCISMGFFAEEDQPVIWRGPMLHKALRAVPHRRLLGRPRLPVVDSPRGHRRHLDLLAQFLPNAEVYIVTTPQPAAQKVAQRAAFVSQKVNLSVKGVIENMSWFTGDDGKRYELFGDGGGNELRAASRDPAARSGPARPAAAGRWRTKVGPIAAVDAQSRPDAPSPPSPSASTSSWRPPPLPPRAQAHLTDPTRPTPTRRRVVVVRSAMRVDVGGGVRLFFDVVGSSPGADQRD